MKQLTLAYSLFVLGITLSFAQKRSDSLVVFVGKKIDVQKFEPELAKGQLPFDVAFKVKYKVIQQVHGLYTKDTIDFVAYDHMGDLAFAKFDYILLFLSYHKGKHTMRNISILMCIKQKWEVG